MQRDVQSFGIALNWTLIMSAILFIIWNHWISQTGFAVAIITLHVVTCLDAWRTDVSNVRAEERGASPAAKHGDILN